MIYIVSGVPGAGKTYYAVRWALRELERKNKSKDKKKIFTNFPLILERKKDVLSSYIWQPEYVYENIFNSKVFVDESYQDYNCKESKNFDSDTQVFFSQQRHNGNDLIMLSPNPARINIIIREMCNTFVHITPHFNIFGHPLYFTTELFLTIEDFNARSGINKTHYGKEFFFFSKKVANAYDTYQFKKEGLEFSAKLWYKSKEMEMLNMLPDDVKEFNNNNAIVEDDSMTFMTD